MPPARAFISGSQWPPKTSGEIPSKEITLGLCSAMETSLATFLSLCLRLVTSWSADS